MKKDNNPGGFPAPDPERGAAHLPGGNGRRNAGDGAASGAGSGTGSGTGGGRGAGRDASRNDDAALQDAQPPATQPQGPNPQVPSEQDPSQQVPIAQGPIPGRNWQQAGAPLSGTAATDGDPATGPLAAAATTAPAGSPGAGDRPTTGDRPGTGDPDADGAGGRAMDGAGIRPAEGAGAGVHEGAGARRHEGAGTTADRGGRGGREDAYGTAAATSFLGRVRSLLGRRNRPVADQAPDGEPEEEATLVAGTHHPIFTGFMLTVGVGLALLLFFILTNVGQLLVWISIALFIALGLDPIVRFLERHQVPRPAGVIAAMLLLALLVGGVFGTLIPTIVAQTTAFAAKAPGFVESFLNSDFFITVDRQFQIRERISEEVDKFFKNSDAVGGVFGGVIGAGSVIAQSVFGLLIVFVLAIYFLASLPGLKAWCYRLAPRSRRARVQALSEQITNSVGNYVMGQVCVALLNAAYAFIVMTIVGVPYSLLLALLVAMLAFVPLVGAVIAGILVSLVALTVGWETAVVYAIFYFGYLQFEAYFISPRVMQRAVAVPGAVAVIAVIAGGSLMGVIGALMAIPLAASAMLLIREVFMARQDRH